MLKISTYSKLLPALISGGSLALCFPGYSWGGLVWLWAVPLMVQLWNAGKEVDGGKRMKWRGFGLSYVAGLAFWMINLYWLMAMGELEGVPAAGAWFSWLGMSAYLALYFGIWGAFLVSVGNPWRQAPAPKQRKKTRVEELVEKKQATAKERADATMRAISGGKKVNILRGLKSSLRVIRFALMHASLWVVLEWLRGWLFTGFTWNGLGVAFHETPIIAQSADLVGVTGLSFLPIVVCSALVQLCARLIQEAKRGKFQGHWEVAFAMGLVALTFVYGVVRISDLNRVETLPVRVLLLQENIKQDLKWGDDAQQVENYESYEANLDAGLSELRSQGIEMAMQQMQAASSGNGKNGGNGGKEVAIDLLEPDIVVLPESAFTQNMYYVDEMNHVLLTMLDEDFLKRGLLSKGEFSVIYGSNLFEGELHDGDLYAVENAKNYNSLAIAPSQVKAEQENLTKSISTYAKLHLVPFGEYFPDIPFRDVIYESLSGSSGALSFTPGESTDPLKLDVKGTTIDVIPAICFEDTVGRVTRKFVRQSPQMIVNVTNDGWFGKSVAARQHMANAMFRAIELRRPMVRAANTGMSGVVDITGSLRDRVTKKRQVIEDEGGDIFVRDNLFAYARVPVVGEITLYAAMGDWFVIFCVMILIAALGVPFLKSKLKLS